MNDSKNPRSETVFAGCFWGGCIWLYGQEMYPHWIRILGLIFSTGYFAYALAFIYIKARPSSSASLDRR